MSAGREGADLFFYLHGRWPGGQLRVWDLFGRRVWRNPYLLHDTFGKRWGRLTLCKHPDPKVVSDPQEPLMIWCFRCERQMNLPEKATDDGQDQS